MVRCRAEDIRMSMVFVVVLWMKFFGLKLNENNIIHILSIYIYISPQFILLFLHISLALIIPFSHISHLNQKERKKERKKEKKNKKQYNVTLPIPHPLYTLLLTTISTYALYQSIPTPYIPHLLILLHASHHLSNRNRAPIPHPIRHASTPPNLLPTPRNPGPRPLHKLDRAKSTRAPRPPRG
jgi:hypothetical protein